MGLLCSIVSVWRLLTPRSPDSTCPIERRMESILMNLQTNGTNSKYYRILILTLLWTNISNNNHNPPASVVVLAHIGLLYLSASPLRGWEKYSIREGLKNSKRYKNNFRSLKKLNVKFHRFTAFP